MNICVESGHSKSLRLQLPFVAHAVARLREAQLALRTKPFQARGSRVKRCGNCRVAISHCLCALRPDVPTNVGMCLIMTALETLKPSNTGWLVADVVPNTWAFAWARTEPNPALLALLADPQWQPYLVFPGKFVAPERVVAALAQDMPAQPAGDASARKPLFVLLDGTWPEARKIFRKSPYLDGLPVLSLQPEHLSTYRLRRAGHDAHFCTAEVAAMCLGLAGEPRAAEVLAAYLAVFTEHYLSAKQSVPVDWHDAVHQRLEASR